MTLADFLATWHGLTLEKRLHRLAVLGLIGTNLVTAVALLRADHTVVLVPPVSCSATSALRLAQGQRCSRWRKNTSRCRTTASRSLHRKG